MSGQLGDGDLLRAARDGDAEAWNALVRRLGSRVWAVTRAHRLSSADAEDVFQLTWLRLVTRLDTIREPDRVGAWLATTARNESLRLLRQRGRQVPSDELQLDGVDEVAPELDSRLLRAERDAVLASALEALPDRCQRLLRVLMAEPEPTYQEASAGLDMPVGSIGPTRARCLQHLREELARITRDPAGFGSSVKRQ